METDWDEDDWLYDEIWFCEDCGDHTGLSDEYYIVNKELWAKHGAGDGMLCSPCLELRVGRRLVPEDFPPLPINTGAFPQSDFLKNRMGKLSF